MYSIGIDLGGTKICTGILSDDGTLVHSIETPTAAEQGPDAVIARMIGTIDDVLRHVPVSDVAGVGIGAPGPLNPHSGMVLGPPNLPGWDAIPLQQEIARACGRRVYLENDANAAAIAEHRYGAGRGVNNMVYVTVSTGIGAGIIVDGRIRQGTTGSFGEVGHIIVSPDGPPCPCGNIGCLETLASGTAIARMAQDVFGREMNAKAVAAMVDQGDETALGILDKAFTYLGIGLVNVVNLFDPEMIIIGGGVAQMGDVMFSRLHKSLKNNKFHHAADKVKLVPARLGTKAGVIGAAAIPFVQIGH